MYKLQEKWRDFTSRIQRFRRGYADRDVWSMYWWFISTVKPMLEMLSSERIGNPCVITSEEWDSILREMISCLRLMDEDEAKKHLQIAEKDYTAVSYRKIQLCMEENKNRFFELFSKWFFDLWD